MCTEHLQLHHQREDGRIDRDRAEARLVEQPQTAADRQRKAEVQHREVSSLAQDGLEAGQHDVAAIERQDRQQVEQADHRACPPQRPGRVGCVEARVQWVHAHRPQPQHADSDLHRGPGEADPGSLPTLQMTRRNEGCVARQEVERDLGSGTCCACCERVTQFVDQGEHGDEHSQPHAESWSVGDHDDQHEEEKPGPDVHGEPEQPKRRL